MIKNKDISSFTLHILAMLLMLCDHLWATILPKQEWLTCIGRIAFPIFAFMIVEGYFNTSNFKKYMQRLLIFACISEIPFNLIVSSSLFYPFHQNVLWTFILGLLGIMVIEKAKDTNKKWIIIVTILLTIIISLIVGTLLFVDYFGPGVLMILVFYLFREKKWYNLLAQFICLAYINIVLLGGYYYEFNLFGMKLEIVQQGFALLALIPIWLYNGRQGYHSKAFQYLCYVFYPLHLLVLYILWQLLL